MTIKSLALLTVSLATLTSLAHAQEGSGVNFAKLIYSSSGVAEAESAAMKMYGVDPIANTSMLGARIVGKIKCKADDKAQEKICTVTVRKDFGWYADPKVTITVEAKIKESRLADMTAEDIEIRSISMTKPEPTGLE